MRKVFIEQLSFKSADVILEITDLSADLFVSLGSTLEHLTNLDRPTLPYRVPRLNLLKLGI